MNPARQFSLCALIAVVALPIKSIAGDISLYGVVKSLRFEQTTTSSPALLLSNGCVFDALVLATTNSAVTNATVKPSNTTPARTLLPDPIGASLLFEERFNDTNTLERVYPTKSGFSPVEYTFTIDTVHDGTQSGAISFYLVPHFVMLNYPATPQISNLADAQSIDTTTDFTLHWNSLGGSALAIVQLLVLDVASNLVFASPAPFQSGALDGTSTSFVIPANRLPPGTNLQAHLVIANPGLPDTNSIAGATGIAALAKDTTFPLITRPAPLGPLLSVASTNASPFRFYFAGETNRNYHIQGTTNFQVWLDLLITNTQTGSGTFTDQDAHPPPTRFYRIQVGP